MKKILFVFCLILNNLTNSCNLCWDYKIKDPRLIREDISHDSECTCPCWQYQHTLGENNFYRCIECGHRLTPPNPLSKKGPQYKRYNENENKSSINPPVFIKKQNKNSKTRNPRRSNIEFPLSNLKK